MSKLRIILVEQGVANVEALAEVCTIIHRLRLKDDLYGPLTSLKPDLVILDVRSPGSVYLQTLQEIQVKHPIPVVIFSQDDTRETIELAVNTGVSAYIVDSLQCPRLLPILQTAMARFKKTRQLQEELVQTREQLQARKIIEAAKGILMQHRQLTEQQAFQLIRKSAMDKNKTLVEISRSILETAELLMV